MEKDRLEIRLALRRGNMETRELWMKRVEGLGRTLRFLNFQIEIESEKNSDPIRYTGVVIARKNVTRATNHCVWHELHTFAKGFPQQATLSGVEVEYSNMVIPRNSIHFMDQDHRFRSGHTTSWFNYHLPTGPQGTLMTELDCKPAEKIVTVYLDKVVLNHKEPNEIIEAFAGACERVTKLGSATQSITQLIQALRTLPRNKGFEQRSIEEAYLRVAELL